MRWIIHDWNDEDSLKILRNCRTAIRLDGTLLIVDAVLKPPNEPDPGKLMDLNMLVLALALDDRQFARHGNHARQREVRLPKTTANSAGGALVLPSRYSSANHQRESPTIYS